jgi:hypothetical protein
MNERYSGKDTVQVANGQGLHISHVGRSSLTGSSKPLHLNHVLYVPRLSKNLLSVHKLAILQITAKLIVSLLRPATKAMFSTSEREEADQRAARCSPKKKQLLPPYQIISRLRLLKQRAKMSSISVQR